MLVSEVVTNALVHAGTPIDLSVTVEDRGVHVAVGDGNPHPPQHRSYGLSAGTGRGLRLLDQLASTWGVDPRADGKTIWFRLSEPIRARGRAAPAGVAAQAPDASPGGVRVDLIGVPLLLAHAWQQHVETLLREHMFATLDDPDVAIQTHAHANDALALLFEHLPAPRTDPDGDPVLLPARQEHAAPRQVQLRVPETSLTHFDVLCRALDDAHRLADQGLLLNHPIQPELRLLARWLCTEVAAQSAGREPTPWTMTIGEPPPATAPLQWEGEDLARATEPMVAVDDTNKIFAVSRTALDLLGYDATDELVGARLLQIIPDRYHEAHLAGFTLHFLTGRSTLIDHTVTVPARRRDGTEVSVDLTVHAHTAPHGRRVFVARLRPR